MKIAYIVPEFDEGGVETHVLNLIRELSGRHDITLITSGGKLESELPENIQVIHLPVHRKNPITIIGSAVRIARLNRTIRWDILHAHSRVPATIAWLTGIKWLMTAHSLYSLNAGLIPLRHADGVICVSEAVRHHIANYLPANVTTIPNGIIPPKLAYTRPDSTRFLFVGRLTRIKGLDTALRALAGLTGYDWTLDVLGDGSQRQELEELSRTLGLASRVVFHGSQDRDSVERFMSCSSCLLFPSYSEGTGLSALEAVSMGLPVIASDLEALREYAEGELVPIGDVSAWREWIQKFLDSGEASRFIPSRIITVHEMARLTESFYANYS